MVDTLTDGALEDRETAGDFLDRIGRDVDRMTVMANELLELSLLESGQGELHLGPLPLKPIAEDVIAQATDRAALAEIEASVDIPDGLANVVGEEDKVRQVLINLVGERSQVHAGRRPRVRGRRGGRQAGRGQCRGHWSGDTGGTFCPTYSSASIRWTDPGWKGYRAGARDSQAHRATPRRRSSRREPRGLWKHILLHPTQSLAGHGKANHNGQMGRGARPAALHIASPSCETTLVGESLLLGVLQGSSSGCLSARKA